MHALLDMANLRKGSLERRSAAPAEQALASITTQVPSPMRMRRTGISPTRRMAGPPDTAPAPVGPSLAMPVSYGN